METLSHKKVPFASAVTGFTDTRKPGGLLRGATIPSSVRYINHCTTCSPIAVKTICPSHQGSAIPGNIVIANACLKYVQQSHSELFLTVKTSSAQVQDSLSLINTNTRHSIANTQNQSFTVFS